jgi:hypothetical protein
MGYGRIWKLDFSWTVVIDMFLVGCDFVLYDGCLDL